MTVAYQWPSTSAFRVMTCSIFLQPNIRTFDSPYTGGSQSIDMLGERWHMTVGLCGSSDADGGLREGFLNRLRLTNLIRAWHFGRPQPKGTQRGALTLGAGVSQGASALPLIGGTSGATLLPGDMLGCGVELFQVADPVTFDGSGHATVNVVNRVRTLAGLPSGTAVVWDKPMTNWRLVSAVAVAYSTYRNTDELSVELIETW